MRMNVWINGHGVERCIECITLRHRVEPWTVYGLDYTSNSQNQWVASNTIKPYLFSILFT